MAVLSAPQRTTLQKCLAAANNVLPKIELLEALGAHSPALRERAAELRARREYIVNIATAALEFDRQIKVE